MDASVQSEVPIDGMRGFLDGLRALGPGRLAAMGLVSVGMLFMLALLVLRGGGGSGGQMALLYGDLDLHEAGQMADLLDKAHVPHRLGANSDQILVPEDDVAAARLLLARSNLPSGGTVGYELFDHADGLTSTQFEQDINRTRALEGELARSIRMIDGVRAARIHLVLPRREAFATETQPSQASVLLTMRGAARLDPEGVQAIVNLVSAAVPGLKPQNIAIIDSHGSVLARAGAASGSLDGDATAEEARKAMELQIGREVEEMLDASLGPDKVRAEASVTYDLSRTNETEESFNPDQQVIRSQQTVSDKNRSTEAQQNTTVQNNLPNADAGRPQAGSQGDRQEETSNYEIGKTVRTRTDTAPRIKRISLAVLVDGQIAAGPDGRPAWQPRSPKELADITALVKSAIGFDASRGDTVTVATMRFNQLADEPLPDAPRLLFGLPLTAANLMQLGQTAIIAAVILVVALFVFRPMIKRLVPTAAVDIETDGRLVGGNNMAALRLPGLDADPALLGMALPEPSFREGRPLVQLDNVEGEMHASSLRQLNELVEEHPDESLVIIRSWLGESSK